MYFLFGFEFCKQELLLSSGGGGAYPAPLYIDSLESCEVYNSSVALSPEVIFPKAPAVIIVDCIREG